MRDYYTRFRRELGTDLSKFLREQVAVNVIVFVAGAFVESSVGLLDGQLLWRSVLAGLTAWGTVFLLRAIWGIIKTPAKLDSDRVKELELGRQEILVRDSRIADLEEQLRRKHPHDEHLEQQIREQLATLDAAEVACVKCLLDRPGKLSRGELRNAGHVSEVADRIAAKTGGLLVTVEIHRQHGGNESDRYYQIGGEPIKQALRNVLYPPSTHK